jgi:hypothetical protein
LFFFLSCKFLIPRCPTSLLAQFNCIQIFKQHSGDALSGRANKGIDLRIKQDMQQFAADAKNAANAAKRLQEKSLVYDKFTKQGTLYDREGDNCLVDFQRKAWDEDENDARPPRPPADWFEGGQSPKTLAMPMAHQRVQYI